MLAPSIALTPIIPAWHVLLTHPREERKAAASLTGHRIKVYLPEITQRKKHGRRMIERDEPMMPGYLFIPASYAIPWRRIRSTPGIRFQSGGSPALMNAGRPARIPDCVMQGVMAKEAKLHKGLEPLPDALKIGQAVEVVDGPFAWVRAVIDDLCKLDTQGRIGVAMALFGRLIKVDLEVSQVRAV